MKNFDEWISGFRESIAGYKYYADFPKVFENVDGIRIELNILNSLVGSRDIEADFEKIITEYPRTLKCIPMLIAKRESEIFVTEPGNTLCYNFNRKNYSLEMYRTFMRETGLFDLLQNHIVSNLVDYVTGVETGLDSNARKNRGGHEMENLVEGYLVKAGFTLDETYFKEMYISTIEGKWGIDLSCISNKGKTEKRFDFVVKGQEKIYGIETNFYSSGGSKLNETARSYKTLALEAKDLGYFKFVWITDGQGWKGARNNLLETCEVLEDLYCIADLESGILSRVLV